MYNENDWQEFRAEVYAYTKNRNNNIIKKWLSHIGYKDENPIGYYICLSSKTIEIYSNRVGALIGRAGCNVDLLEKMLADEFRGKWQVKFFEIRGGFVNANEVDNEKR